MDHGDSSALARLLGGLIEANLGAGDRRRRDFEELDVRVGIEVVDAGEAVTLDFGGGRLHVHNGLQDGRRLTVRGCAAMIMELSSLRPGPLGLPFHLDSTGGRVLLALLGGDLRIDGMFRHPGTLVRLTRLLSAR